MDEIRGKVFSMHSMESKLSQLMELISRKGPLTQQIGNLHIHEMGQVIIGERY